MADDNGNDELSGYFVVKFEKYIKVMEEYEHKYQMLADIIHEHVLATLPDFWDDTPIKDLMETYVAVADLRNFLEDKINNVSEEEVKLAQKYNIKDILTTTEELARMNNLLVSCEELEKRIEVEHKISLATH